MGISKDVANVVFNPDLSDGEARLYAFVSYRGQVKKLVIANDVVSQFGWSAKKAERTLGSLVDKKLIACRGKHGKWNAYALRNAQDGAGTAAQGTGTPHQLSDNSATLSATTQRHSQRQLSDTLSDKNENGEKSQSTENHGLVFLSRGRENNVNTKIRKINRKKEKSTHLVYPSNTEEGCSEVVVKAYLLNRNDIDRKQAAAFLAYYHEKGWRGRNWVELLKGWKVRGNTGQDSEMLGNKSDVPKDTEKGWWKVEVEDTESMENANITYRPKQDDGGSDDFSF